MAGWQQGHTAHKKHRSTNPQRFSPRTGREEDPMTKGEMADPGSSGNNGC